MDQSPQAKPMGLGERVVWIVVALLIVVGTYFVAGAVFAALQPLPQTVDPGLAGIAWFQNLYISNGNAALGAALYVAAIAFTLLVVVQKHMHWLEDQARLQEKQTAYLRYLAEQAREQSRKP